MEGKVLSFDNSAKNYIALAEKYVEAEEYEKALRFYFCALNKEYSFDTLADIARAYSEIGLYELSNRYWIKFLNSAPESTWGEAYEELGINHFNLDNIFVSSYYLKKKVDKDGFLSSDDLGDEIKKYFSNVVDNKSLYKVVYPPDKASFTEELKIGKSLIASASFDKAIEILSTIPVGAKEYYDALDEISLAEFLSGNIEEAISLNKKIIKERGENISCFCNLSSIYNLKGDGDKSNYYYKKAIELPITKDEEEYKLATCSLEQNEHKKAINFISKIITEKPYELNLKYLLGLAYINDGDYKKGKDVFYDLVNLAVDNPVYSYYLYFASSLIDGNESLEKLLPLAYEDDIPKQERVIRKKRIQKYISCDIVKMRKKLATQEFLEDVRWAFYRSDEECIKTMAFLLVSLNDKRSDKIIFDTLTDSNIHDSVKGAILFSLIISGYSGKIGLSCSHFYNRFKIRSLGFEDDENMNILYLAYALLMTKLAFLEIDNFDKVAFSANKIYRKFKDTKALDIYSKDELAGLMLFLCKYKRFQKQEIVKFLKIKKEKLEALIELYQGDKND